MTEHIEVRYDLPAGLFFETHTGISSQPVNLGN